MKHININMSDDLINRLRVYAVLSSGDSRPNVSNVVAEALEEYFERRHFALSTDKKPNTKR